MNKQEIKAWLKSIGKDRFWLAEQLLCKKRTIDAWLSSSANIPTKVQRIITRLMAQYSASANTLPSSPNATENTLVLTVNDSTFDLWNAAAIAENKLLRQWCIDVLTNAAQTHQ